MPRADARRAARDPQHPLLAAGRTIQRRGGVGHVAVSRTPYTVSDVALLGGGQFLAPGNLTCYHGVLFLDELPEFKRSALETLRQPLEDAG